MTLKATDLKVMNFDKPIFADESIMITTSVSRSQPAQQTRHQPFPVVAATRTWKSLPQHVTSASSLVTTSFHSTFKYLPVLCSFHYC